MEELTNNKLEKPAILPNPALDDIQGLILRGYRFNYIKYIILNIQDIPGAQLFCKNLASGSNAELNITTAKPWDRGYKPPYCLNIAFTYAGLLQMIGDVNCKTVADNSRELFSVFKKGATDSDNCLNIGDTDDSAPANWWTRGKNDWLLPNPPDPSGNDLHLQITLFTQIESDREVYYDKLMKMIPVVNGKPALMPAFIKDSEPIDEGDKIDYIHFDYKDSLSQPRIGDVPWNNKLMNVRDGELTYDDRPVVPSYNFAYNNQSPYKAHKLLYNGGFAAFRFLYQDVKAFKAFIAQGEDPDLIAAKMCGRWADGTPLVISPTAPNPELKGFDYTNFNYITPTDHQKGPKHNDTLGEICPYAAHIRRANPRDDYNVTGNVNYAGINRVMRRASPYGPKYVEGEPDGIQRGLIGLFIGCHLFNQFQFIMKNWISKGKFRNPDATNNRSGIDPLFGSHAQDGDPMHKYLEYITEEGAKVDVPNMTRFIRTDGSLYLFIPGINALKAIAAGALPS
ncbi:hypothetical protein HDF19_13430 [Mucilaginibacter sp. E4BP6]|uniref:hypothetical protein n=1 Tax=Mucilaginibacter sp. E4BP6 TaxID=2723089 RepID=UPI0015CD9750|nr:hypothetical protein [Mucilaginibacter sp. E4BP6]NYE66016.1 hypothetical protein [Mucilaginibacter sp. E4BP6]